MDIRRLLLLTAAALALSVALPAAASSATDQRARIVESNLKDLSAANDAAIARHRLEPNRELDAMGSSRVALRPEQTPSVDTRVGQDVQSSLHRLRRETVSSQTADGRKARVEDSLDRAARQDP